MLVRIRAALVAVLTAVLAVLGAGVVVSPASAATGDVGYQGPSYSGVPNVPTSDKPQSKLWYAQGAWWADMFDTGSGTWHIFRLNRSTEQWTDTGVRVDDRMDTLADVLWDGSHVYIASHVVTASSEGTVKPSLPDSPARLYRYSWTGSAWRLDTGFPTVITTRSSESLTIDKDSTGTVWATWTQVAATSTGGYTSAVYANATTGGDATWGTPFVVPVDGSTVAPDDISTVVSYAGRIGVLWSNQLDDTVYWAVHTDGTTRTTWKGGPALRGTKEADDHLNVKAVQADASGRVFAVVKTSHDQAASPAPTDPQIRLLNFKPATGSWTATTVSTVADCQTRPQLVLDEGNQTVHVFATGPSAAGCPFSGAPGSIYDKTAPMGEPVFAAGRGTPVIREAASPNINDVTAMKQSVTAASGIVVLASNKTTLRYWHADLSAAAAPAPVASFTTSAASGEAPLPVRFTDTSQGAPTAWRWSFGDGGTSTEQNPAHTFTTPGSYTVSLVASNATGSSAAATGEVTVTGPAASGGVSARASSSAASATATPTVTVPAPAGLSAGDLLVAQLTVDLAPTITAGESGWTRLITTAKIGSGAKVYAWSRRVTDPTTEPAAYTWQLSTAVKWGAGITAFSGVDPTSPFDGVVGQAQDTTFASATLAVPGPVTTTDGAMLVGGIGLDNATTAVTEPAGWTEDWEATGGQVAQLAHRTTATAGPTGTLTWSMAKAVASAGWVAALRPAPHAPVASFTASVVSGTTPLEVRFTDTSGGGATTWAWDFGDGTTSTEQNPSHTFTSVGTSTVTLTTSNAVGSSKPATRSVVVVPAPPVAAFTSSVATGTAPLAVAFTDTSAGSAAAWAWDFGDGATATEQNPAHTYRLAGTYTVKLIASNAGGGSAATAVVTVSAKVGATVTATSKASSKQVTVARPAGVADGDVLVARVTTTGRIKSAPAGWTAAAGGALYYHLVTRAAAEPASYVWSLAPGGSWSALVTVVSGIDPRTPAAAVPYAQAGWPAA